MTLEFQAPEKGFFDRRQKTQVQALFRRLLPSDDQHGVPGADEAGAADYLDRLLAMDHETYYEIKHWRQKLYPEGLDALDQAARGVFGKPLVDLQKEQCDELLARLETGKLQPMPEGVNQKVLFRTLWRHCLQGCFCDPRWSGNRNSVMWKWYGYLQEPDIVKIEGGCR